MGAFVLAFIAAGSIAQAADDSVPKKPSQSSHANLKKPSQNPNASLAAQHVELLDAVADLAQAVDDAGWQVTALVDEDLCDGAAATTPCSNGGTGHTRVAASSTNFNPVTIYVLVQSADGKAVDFLAQNQILFENRVGPGLNAEACGSPQDTRGCVVEFNAIGNGQYVLYVHPAVGNWNAETYNFSITLFDDQNEVRGRTIGQINIPN